MITVPCEPTWAESFLKRAEGVTELEAHVRVVRSRLAVAEALASLDKDPGGSAVITALKRPIAMHPDSGRRAVEAVSDRVLARVEAQRSVRVLLRLEPVDRLPNRAPHRADRDPFPVTQEGQQ